MRPCFLRLPFAALTAVLIGSEAAASPIPLDFSSATYLGWAVESVDSQQGETDLINSLIGMAPGASAVFQDGSQVATAYRSNQIFPSSLTTAIFSAREEDEDDLHQSFSISGVGYVIAKFGSGLKDSRTITGYTSGKNPKPQYAPSTHVWFLDPALLASPEVRVSGSLNGLSHVSIFAAAAPPPPSSVPDGGTTLALIAGAFAFLALHRRRFG